MLYQIMLLAELQLNMFNSNTHQTDMSSQTTFKSKHCAAVLCLLVCLFVVFLFLLVSSFSIAAILDQVIRWQEI